MTQKYFDPEVGMALVTKNPHKVGNAFIISKESPPSPFCKESAALFYTVVTDFGHTLELLPSVINEMFDVADWWLEMENRYKDRNVMVIEHRCPIQRVKRQIELLSKVVNKLEGEQIGKSSVD